MYCALDNKLFKHHLFALVSMVRYVCVIHLLFLIIHLCFIFGVLGEDQRTYTCSKEIELV